MSTVRTTCLALLMVLPWAGARRGARRFVALALAGLVLAAPARVSADDQAVLDLQAAIRAQRALEQDPVLGPLQLWVTVRNGVATLRAPVPPPEIAARAVACLRQQPEVSEVRLECFDLPVGRLGVVPVPGQPRLPHWAASRTQEGKQPAPPARVRSLVAVPASRPSAALLSAIVPVPAPQAAPAAPGLEEAVRQLQRSQQRFLRLRVEIEGTRAYVSGVARTWADLYALSEALTHLPGVSGVTLRAIRLDPAAR